MQHPERSKLGWEPMRRGKMRFLSALVMDVVSVIFSHLIQIHQKRLQGGLCFHMVVRERNWPGRHRQLLLGSRPQIPLMGIIMS